MDTTEAPLATVLSSVAGSVPSTKPRASRDAQPLALEHWASWLSSALALIPGSSLVMDHNAMLVAASPRAHDILNEGDGLCLRNKQVRATTRADQIQFMQAMKPAGTARYDTHGVLVRRAYGRYPLHLSVRVMETSQLLRTVSGGTGHEAFVRVDITDVDSEVQLNLATLRRLFDLTPREIDIAELFARGISLTEVSDVLCISVDTVRSHLKQMFVKTNTKRQSQLMRVLVLSART